MDAFSAAGFRHLLRNKVLPAVAVLGIIAATLAVVQRIHAVHEHEQTAAASRTPALLPVAVLPAERVAGFTAERRFSGTLTARQQVELAFQISGRIAAVEVDIGDRVEAGAPLARLDTRRLDNRRQRLAAGLREAAAELALAEASLARRSQLQRDRLVAGETVDEARAARDRALARQDALRAELDALEIDLSDSVLRAPFAAVVTERRAEVGRISGPEAPDFRLLALDRPEVRIGLPAHEIRRLAIGQRVRLDWRGDSLAGRVRALVPALDGATRTAVALVEPDHTPLGLTDGESVQLVLPEHTESPGFWVPNSALVAAPRGLWAVYLARPETAHQAVVERAVVEVLHSNAERSFVRGTLNPGDPVIVDGIHRLGPGQRVVISHERLSPAGYPVAGS